MYRIAQVPKGHQIHTGSDFEESHVFYNNDPKAVEICKGPRAKIDAQKFVSNHSWAVKQNEHGLGDISIAA